MGRWLTRTWTVAVLLALVGCGASGPENPPTATTWADRARATAVSTASALPTIVNPAEELAEFSPTGLLRWSEVTGADAYEVWAYDDAALTRVAEFSKALASRQYQFTQLAAGRTYHVKLYVRVNGAWTSTPSFQLKAAATPVIKARLTNSQEELDGLGARATLRWTPVANADKYEIWVYRDAVLTALAETSGPLEITQYALRTLVPNATYHAQVYARVGGVYRTGGALTVRTTDQSKRARILNPQEELDAFAADGILRWSPVNGATAYELWVFRDPNSAQTQEGSGSMDVRSYKVRTLQPGTTYYAQAYARVNGEWQVGAPVKFTTVATPTRARLTNVQGELESFATNGTLRWTEVPGATAYEVWIYGHPGLGQVVESGAAGTERSYATAKLCAGATYYAQVYSRVNGAWTTGWATRIDTPAGTDPAGCVPPAPPVTFDASALEVESGRTVTLSWSARFATSCAASDAWSGSKAASGTEAVLPLTRDSLYTLVCTGPGGSTRAQVLVASNSAPTAVAGASQTVAVGATVALDGSASTDPDNDTLTYAWTLPTRPPGSAAVLADATTAKPSFVADVAGTYAASLVVSDGRTSSAPATVSVTASWILKSFVIPDPTAYYKDRCEFPSMPYVIPVRLNEDAFKDFIVHYWCSAPLPWGREITTPTPDALVALASQGDGTYAVANEQVFGSRIYGLGGASRKFVRGDINGDGRDDFAFAMNWEDGRSGARAETNATESSVLLSTPDGGYRVTRLGKPNWNHAVEIVRNANSVDVVFAGFTGPVQGFRHHAAGFIDVSQEYRSEWSSAWASSFRAIPDATSGATQLIASTANRQSPNSAEYSVTEWGIRLLSKQSSLWTPLREFWKSVEFTVKWISWQITQGTNSVISVDGKQYFGGAYDEMCVMPPLVKGGSRLLLAKMGAAQDNAGRTLVAGGTYSEGETTPVNFYNFFELSADAEFKPLPSPIVGEETKSNFNFFDCGDINGDGLPDLVSRAYTRPGFNERVAERGKPAVYLNDGKGQLVRVDLGMLPGHSAGNELQGQFVDVNGDGMVDLMLFGSATDGGGGAIEVHLLRAPLRLP